MKPVEEAIKLRRWVLTLHTPDECIELRVDWQTERHLWRERDKWTFETDEWDNPLYRKWRGMRVIVVAPEPPKAAPGRKGGAPAGAGIDDPFFMTIIVRRRDTGKLEYYDHPASAAPHNTGIKAGL